MAAAEGVSKSGGGGTETGRALGTSRRARDLQIGRSAAAAFGVVLAAAILVGVWWGFTLPASSTNFETEWVANLYARKTALIEETEGPRVLLVAGSEGLFSQRAELVAEATGMPAINFATHAGLGNDFLIENAIRLAEPGDTLVLPLGLRWGRDSNYAMPLRSWRYVMYYDTSFLKTYEVTRAVGSASVVPFGAAERSHFFRFDALGTRPRVLNGRRGIPLGSLSPTGDLDIWRKHTTANVVVAAPDIDEGRWRTQIARLAEKAERAGLRVVLSWTPHTPSEKLRERAPEIDRVIREIAADVGIEVAGSLESFFVTRDMLGDTRYHATPVGALVGSWRLVDGLRDVGLVPEAEASSPRAVLGRTGDDRRLSAMAIRLGAARGVVLPGEVRTGDLVIGADALPLAYSAGLGTEWVELAEADEVPGAGAERVLVIAASPDAAVPDALSGLLDGGEAAIVGAGDVTESDDGLKAIVESSIARSPHTLQHHFESAGGVSPEIEVNGHAIGLDSPSGGTIAAVFSLRLGVIESLHRFDGAGQRIGTGLWRVTDGESAVMTERPVVSFEPVAFEADAPGASWSVPVPDELGDADAVWLELTYEDNATARLECRGWFHGGGDGSDQAGVRLATFQLAPGPGTVSLPLMRREGWPRALRLGIVSPDGDASLRITGARFLARRETKPGGVGG